MFVMLVGMWERVHSQEEKQVQYITLVEGTGRFLWRTIYNRIPGRERGDEGRGSSIIV
jgi:hypothetical protein